MTAGHVEDKEVVIIVEVPETKTKLKELTPKKGEESGSKKIVDDNRCSGSRHKETNIAHKCRGAFQGHSEHCPTTDTFPLTK
ncbi:hypothetical protein HUJ04_011367 [Dendroctonus ponderosae]|nr:hypothetical protein HUJ04_011367 [Dendroctonus ponderosae]